MKKNNKKNKNGNNIIDFMKDKKSQIGCLVVGAIIGALVMIPFFPKRITTLANGEQVLVQIDGKKITADEFYSKLKLGHSDTLFSMVDEYILESKYPDLEEDANAYAEKNAEEIYTTYESYYGYTKEQFLAGNGFDDEEDFFDYLKEQFYYQTYYDEYVDKTITDKEIDKYYKDHVFGERAAYVFTIEEDYAQLDKVRDDLKKGKTFTKIQEKYQSVHSYNYETINFTDTTTLSQTILDKIGKTKKGKYSDIFKDDMYGYVVVYVADAKSKPSLEDVKSQIVEMIRVEKQENDESLYYKAFIDLREDYNMVIYDTELKDNYEEAKKEFK